MGSDYQETCDLFTKLGIEFETIEDGYKEVIIKGEEQRCEGRLIYFTAFLFRSDGKFWKVGAGKTYE